jgi:2-C-methyl-D-erythritol 4-phosphate cytidylyltransferase/2-C-methyl-D-erythritol 2,4-cyclodiphosphate synthase
LIILAAGSSSRFEKKAAKQWLRSGEMPLWLAVTQKLAAEYPFARCVVTGHPDDLGYMQQFVTPDAGIILIPGGAERQLSLKSALASVSSEYVLVTDVARACVDAGLMRRLLDSVEGADCVVPFIGVPDTVVYGDSGIDRTQVKRIQTPQLSRTAFLKQALEDETLYTDESTLVKAHGGNVVYVQGQEQAAKITFAADLAALPCIQPPVNDTFVGNGFDVHAFETGRKMVLCGVEIRDVDYGFKAHSDGDVGIHALIDAILGAAGAGDIGELFPDTDDAFKGIDSKILLEECVRRVSRYGFDIVNADITIIAQAPRLGAYKSRMKETIARILGIAPFRVNIKATTTEKLGFVGRKEGVAVMATASLKYFDWTLT